ncbi:MAG: hypothetical protein IPN86_15510 [Saprospiraceae bacterium]|nr:hypothetical protein [Saprospiraceae bacterium]
MRLDLPNRNLNILSHYQNQNFGDIWNRFTAVKNAAFLIMSIFVFNVSFIENTNAQTTCTGNVPIQNLANGMNYTITVGPTSGNVTISVTVVDNPAGLVGFLGGPGNPISFPNGSGTFTYNLTGQANPYVLNMYFNWAAGGQGSSTAVSCAAATAPTICTGNVPIQNLANGMNYTITAGPTSGNVTVSVTVVDNPAGLVGFLGGPGNPISFPNGSGTFTYNLTGQATPYVLNMYFNWAAGGQGSSTVVSCPATAPPPAAPTTGGPNPVCPGANVISLFSNAYTNVPVDTWLTPWSAAPVTLTDLAIGGNNVKFYQNVTFLGIETTGANRINATNMTTLRLDFWSGNATQFRIKLVDWGANGNFGVGDDTEHELTFNNPALNSWVSYNIPLSDFVGLASRANLAQYILSAMPDTVADFYIDNFYFANGSCVSAAPAVAVCPAANVISLFSNNYTNVPVDTWLTPWSAAPVTLTDVNISGNNAKFYQDVTFLGIETTTNRINATAMTHFKIDVWSGNATQFRIKLVDFGANGAFGGGDDSESELTFNAPALNTWITYNIPLSSFTGLTSRANLAQYILSAMPNAIADFYIDNMLFTNCLPSAPTMAAPAPTCPSANVLSMFSNTYTNVPVDTWRTPWSSATLADIQIAGNDTKLYTNLDFVGVETVGPNLLNLTNMTHMHLDIWTPNMTTIRVKLVDFGPNRNFGGGDDSEHEVILNCTSLSGWNSFHIPLSGFTNLRSRAQIAQLILSGLPTGQGTLYVDNVYFSTCAPSTGMQVPVTISIAETSGLLINDGTICAGATATLTASGGGTYAWSTGATTASITASTAGAYTVTVTNAGCAFPVSTTIIVTPLPNAAIAVTDVSGTTNNDGIICQGATATLTASGGGTYLWSNGATTAGITTGVAGTYTVTVTNNGCIASTSRTITVNPLPTASISLSETSGPVDNDGMVYEGAVVYLTASGGGTYLWSTGATTANITVTPMATTTYTVTVTNSNGCTATASRIITVEPNLCLLVCSGNQNVTLPGGVCEWQVPNLVTKTGICEDLDIVPPPVVGFSGAFAYANRWFHNTANGSDPTYGNLPCTNIAGLPGTLVLQSADVLSGGNTCNWFGTVVAWRVPANGTISFNWATQTNDPTWDHFGYSLTNDPNTPTGMFGTTLQASTIELASVTASGTVSIPVTAGQIFSLVNRTDDGGGGPLTATINNFQFQEAQVTLPWTIVQTAGPVAGSFVGAGTYQMCYELRDPRGGVADQCCFTITVGNYSNPTSSLVANDQVNVSLDDDGWSLVTTDMILEGGPYGCYDGYLMRRNPVVSGTPPTQALTIPLATNPAYPGYTYGGVWVNCSDIGKRIEVEVLDPATGNRAWGYVIVEDKIAPVVTCNCQDIDIPTPVTSFAGSLDATDPVFDRCGFTGYGTWPYDVYEFTVSTTGNYTFTASSPAGDTYAYINANTFSAADPCTGNIAQNDDGAGGLDPLITVNLTAGTTYYYIFTNWSPFDAPSGGYTVTITGPGQVVTIVNPSEDPACQFACYDIEIVKRETVGMLYNIPGLNANKSKLTTPPTYTDNCGVTSVTFEDRVTSTNCGASKLIRDWKYVDGFGNSAICSQTFTFNQISVFDLAVPTREVHLSCGLDASPAAIAGYTDIDSRPQPASAANIGAFADDYAATPTVVELNEGYANGYFTYLQRGFDGNMHPQKVDNGICNIYTSYTDQMINACGIGCGGNMKVIRTWTILDWCTGDVFTYIQVIKATDEKAPTFNVKDVTISVDPWGCAANWNVDLPWELQDNCAKAEELKWGVKAPAGVTVTGTQPNYRLSGMPKGTHAITYWASDCCGNLAEAVAFVTVIDASAPVAVAKQNIVMSLTGSGTGADGAGKIYGWQIDNGSYDQCSDVRFEVRRPTGAPSCGNIGANGTHNNNTTYNGNNFLQQLPNNPGVWFHPGR